MAAKSWPLGGRKLQKARREADRSPDAAAQAAGGWGAGRPQGAGRAGSWCVFSSPRWTQRSASRKLPHSSPGELRPLLGPRAVGLAWQPWAGHPCLLPPFPRLPGAQGLLPAGDAEAQVAALLPPWPRPGQGPGREAQGREGPRPQLHPPPWVAPQLIWVRARLGRVRRRYSSNGQIVRGGDKGHRPRAWLREGGAREAVASRPLAPPRPLQASWVSPSLPPCLPPRGQEEAEDATGTGAEGWWWPLYTVSGDCWGQRPDYRGKGG